MAILNADVLYIYCASYEVIKSQKDKLKEERFGGKVENVSQLSIGVLTE